MKGAVLRLRRLAAGCPAPSSLTRALEPAAATFWTEQGFREALTLMGLSEGTAGAPLVRALSML